jgi:hypothetical protein
METWAAGSGAASSSRGGVNLWRRAAAAAAAADTVTDGAHVELNALNPVANHCVPNATRLAGLWCHHSSACHPCSDVPGVGVALQNE